MIPKCRCCGIRPAENAGLDANGKTMYRDYCWKCHEYRNLKTNDVKKRKENEIFLSENYGGATITPFLKRGCS